MDVEKSKLIDELLHSRSEPNEIIDGKPLLWYALEQDSPYYVEKLIKAGANVNATVDVGGGK